MKVYLVYDGDVQEGLIPLHIASTEEMAKQWIKDNCKTYGQKLWAEISEVEVDGKFEF